MRNLDNEALDFFQESSRAIEAVHGEHWASPTRSEERGDSDGAALLSFLFLREGFVLRVAS